MKRFRLSVGAVAFCALAASFGAQAADGASAGTSLKMATAGLEASQPARIAVAPAAEAAQAGPVPNCARKVKVVYSGYGEAERASCATAAATTATIR
jgi:hypothetical protein